MMGHQVWVAPCHYHEQCVKVNSKFQSQVCYLMKCYVQWRVNH